MCAILFKTRLGFTCIKQVGIYHSWPCFRMFLLGDIMSHGPYQISGNGNTSLNSLNNNDNPFPWSPLTIQTRKLIEMVSDLVWSMDLEGHWIFLNRKAAREIYGYEPEEMMGRHFSEFVSPEQAQKDTLEFEKIKNGEQISSFDTVHIRKNGTYVNLNFNPVLLKIDYDKIIGFTGIAREIKYSNNDNKNILNAIQDGISVHGLDFEIREVNRTIEQWFSNEMPLQGRKCYDAYFGGTQPCKSCPAIRALKKNQLEIEHIPYTNPSSNKDGWLEICAFPLTENGGEPIGVVEYVRDVTKRIESEHALKESAASYRALAVNLPGLAYRMYLDGKKGLQVFNNQLQVLTGYELHEIEPDATGIACPLDCIVIPEDREHLHSSLKEALRKNRSFEVEYRIRHKNGEILHVRERGKPVSGDDGHPVHYDGFIFDITRHRSLEEELLKAKILDSISVMAGGIAHDFNNLLAVILGNLSIIKGEAGIPNSLLLRLNDAEEAVLRARDLTQRIMTFSRGGAPVTRTAPVERVIQDAAGVAIASSNTLLDIQIPDDLWLAVIDKNQIRQVFTNLIVNADQAMPNGGRILVNAKNIKLEPNIEGLSPFLSQGLYVKITIQDEG